MRHLITCSLAAAVVLAVSPASADVLMKKAQETFKPIPSMVPAVKGNAITGDKIGTPEKIAGDALYGGLLGAVASIADAAFEAITGKDVGDTVLALFTGTHDDKAVAVAANTQAPAASAPAAPDASFQALSDALSSKGVDSTLSQRALAAYQKSMILSMAQTSPVLAAAQ